MIGDAANEFDCTTPTNLNAEDDTEAARASPNASAPSSNKNVNFIGITALRNLRERPNPDK